MILVTKHNVTATLLESIRSAVGTAFLLQTPIGIRQFRLGRTNNTKGMFRHRAGILVLRAQGPYIVFSNDQDILLHGDVTELVDYIKNDNYVVVPYEE